MHPKVIHLKGVFALKIDPRVNPFLSINRAGGQRSDRRGDIECDQTLACTRGRIDSRDQQADEAVAQYDPEALGERGSGGGLSEAQEPEQPAELLASWLKRELARGRKERRNIKQHHGELMKLGSTERCCMDRGGDGIRPFPSGSVRRCVRTQAVRVRSLCSELSGRP